MWCPFNADHCEHIRQVFLRFGEIKFPSDRSRRIRLHSRQGLFENLSQTTTVHSTMPEEDTRLHRVEYFDVFTTQYTN